MLTKTSPISYFVCTGIVVIFLIILTLYDSSPSRELDHFSLNIQRLTDNCSSLIYLQKSTQSESRTTTEEIINTTNCTCVPNSIRRTPKEEIHTTQVKLNTSSPNKPDLNVATSGLTNELYEPGYDIPNRELCPDLGASLKIVILILSAPNHSSRRTAIRQTWGSFARRRDIQMSFILGRNNSTNLTSAIESESALFGDVILARFMDSYNNLTLKTISIMEWVDHYCPMVKFVLKTDDDMFINVPRLIDFVTSRRNCNRTIFGRLAKQSWAFRNKMDKYYVPPEQYAPAIFPDFVTGPAYLFTGDIARDSYVTALRTKFVQLEDVFMTGMVAPKMGVMLIHREEFHNLGLSFHSSCELKKFISITTSGNQSHFELYKKFLDSLRICG